MRVIPRNRATAVLASAAAIGIAIAFPLAQAQARSASPALSAAPAGVGNAGDESEDLAASLDAYAAPRLSPSAALLPGAYTAAWNHILAMPVHRGVHRGDHAAIQL